MTAKEFVQSKYPDARAERHVQGRVKGLQTTYWLVRQHRNQVGYIAHGSSESNAWVNAKKRILELEKKPQ